MKLLSTLVVLSTVVVTSAHPLDGKQAKLFAERAPLAIDKIDQHIHPTTPRPADGPFAVKSSERKVEDPFEELIIGKWQRRSETGEGAESIGSKSEDRKPTPTSPEDTTSETKIVPTDNYEAQFMVVNRHNGRKRPGHNKKRGARAPDYKTTSVDGSNTNEESTQEPGPTSSPE